MYVMQYMSIMVSMHIRAHKIVSHIRDFSSIFIPHLSSKSPPPERRKFQG